MNVQGESAKNDIFHLSNSQKVSASIYNVKPENEIEEVSVQWCIKYVMRMRQRLWQL